VARIEAAYRRRERNIDADRYSIQRPGNRLAIVERQRILLAGLARRGINGLGQLDILDVGCGVGAELALLVAIGAKPDRLSGIDIRPDAIEAARSLIPGAALVPGDAQQMPYPEGRFDLVYQAMALSSMPSFAMRRNVAAEMSRVTRSGGVIVSYDFAWNPLNRDTVESRRRTSDGCSWGIPWRSIASPWLHHSGAGRVTDRSSLPDSLQRSLC